MSQKLVSQSEFAAKSLSSCPPSESTFHGALRHKRNALKAANQMCNFTPLLAMLIIEVGTLREARES